jgi:LysM repeat protein/ABC-type branched-subunit amino acid transport system substrate-binding protein
MKNLLSILIITLFSATVAYAQPDVVPVEVINGQQCYVHKVAKGQTAYGISKMYKTTVKKIFNNNPAAKDGLDVGQILYIPTGESAAVDPPFKNEVVNEIIGPNHGKVDEKMDLEGLQKEVFASEVDTNKIIHTVTAGETMYALAKKYGVAIEDLQAANSGSVNLKIGDKIVIPVEKANKNNDINPLIKDPINTSVNPGDSVILHTVEAGQTFYYLTKLYEVSELDIKEANDGLADGLKKGQIIKIIVPKKGFVDNTIESFPFVFDSTSRIEEVYDIAILLPFMLDENDKYRAKCPPVGDCPIYGYTMMSLNFQRGIMMAVDSLKKAGMNVNIHVFDTENDTAVMSSILRKPEMKGVDLIFGPLFPRQIKMVTEYAKENRIQTIVPVPVSNKALYKNPYVSKYSVSTPTQVKYMGEYIAKNFSDANVIAIKNSGNKQDGYYFDEFVKSYNAAIALQPSRLRDSVLTTKMSSSSKLTSVESKMSATSVNLIVVPSEDVGHVSNFITKLSATTNRNPYSKYEVMVFGLEDFMTFETIDEKYKNRYNLHIVASNYTDYNSKEVNDFVLAYRIKYGIDPDKYTMNGFDAAFTNLKGLLLYGSVYTPNYPSLKNDKGYAAGSDYKMVEPGSGYENQSVQVLRYNDYRIEIVKD